MINRALIFLTLFSFTFMAHGAAITKNYQYENYDKAMSSPQYLKFDMASTKFGLFTSSFTGVVKNFALNYEKNDENFTRAVISFEVKNMDTDNSSRNEKMFEKCFEVSKYPKIIVKLPNDIPTSRTKFINEPAIMNIRGINKNIKVDLEFITENEKQFIVGSSVVKLSELNIPDPSIAIASVRDTVEISFKLEL